MTKNEMKEAIKRLCVKGSTLNVHERFESYFGGYKNIVVYGAGNAGGITAKYIKDYCGREITCFLDRNADSIGERLGIPVYAPDDSRLTDEFKKNAIVIIAVLFPEHENQDEFFSGLRNLGYHHYYRYYYYYFLGPLYCYDKSGRNDRAILVRESDKIIEAFDMMSDEHSREVFFKILKAIAEIDFGIAYLSQGMTQYIDVGIPMRNKYSNFVDCGAYTGDTFEMLVKYHKVENYFAFEPNMLNYVKLCESVEKVPDVRSVCLPLGVSDKNELLSFGGQDSSGRIAEDGDAIIQTVRLDDVLKGYDNLMLKMDIEGAEIAALKGARSIITKTKPDLAICVYHSLSDLWRIPLMLKEWVPEYRLYMRSHFPGGAFETVVYATIGDEDNG